MRHHAAYREPKGKQCPSGIGVGGGVGFTGFPHPVAAAAEGREMTISHDTAQLHACTRNIADALRPGDYESWKNWSEGQGIIPEIAEAVIALAKQRRVAAMEWICELRNAAGEAVDVIEGHATQVSVMAAGQAAMSRDKEIAKLVIFCKETKKSRKVAEYERRPDEMDAEEVKDHAAAILGIK